MSYNMVTKNNDTETRTADVWGLQSDINRLFDAFMMPFERADVRTGVSPKLDIVEMKDKYEIKAEMAGIDEKDIDLSINDGVLTIGGEKKTETENADQGYCLKECSYGSFNRSIRLPKDIDESKVVAFFKNGVLTVDVPKAAGKLQSLKKIPIKV